MALNTIVSPLKGFLWERHNVFFLFCFVLGDEVCPSVLRNLVEGKKGSDFAPKKPHNATRSKTDLASILKWLIHYFGVAHNTSYLPPKHFVWTLILTWESSRHFATSPLVSLRNEAWETSAEIPYWWRVTTQIWIVLLIGWSKFLTNQKHYPPNQGSDTLLVWNFFVLLPKTSFRGETSEMTRSYVPNIQGYPTRI